MIRKWIKKARQAAQDVRDDVLGFHDEDTEEDVAEGVRMLGEGLTVEEDIYLYVTGPLLTDTFEVPIPKGSVLLFAPAPILEDAWETRLHPAHPKEN